MSHAIANKKFPHHGQYGIAMVMGMVMLLVLTILAVVIVQVVTLQGKMARNLKDQAMAFQAGEAALRSAEVDISDGLISGETAAVVPPNPLVRFTSNFKFTNFTTTCTIAGVSESYARCLPSVTTTPQWQSVTWAASSTDTLAVSALTLPTGVALPRYIVELLSGKPSFDASTGCSTAIFRISARGYGPNGAVSNLQSVYSYQPMNCI